MQTQTITVQFAPLRPARQLIVAALAGVPQLFTYDATRRIHQVTFTPQGIGWGLLPLEGDFIYCHDVASGHLVNVPFASREPEDITLPSHPTPPTA